MSRIWCPTLFQDAHAYFKACNECQRFKKKIKLDNMPLRPLMRARAFAIWGIDFVGPIDPPTYKKQAQYIIVATDYLTKWVKARATKCNNAQTTTKFLYKEIFIRYVLPIKLVNDCKSNFFNDVIVSLLDKFLIIQNLSTPYQPQENGQAKSTNKTLSTFIT